MSGRMVPAVALAPGETHAQAAAREIERHLDRGGWDQPNHLYALTLVDGNVCVEEFGNPFEYHAAAFLLAFAEEMVSTPDVAATVHKAFPRLCGLAVAVETWAVSVPKDSPEAFADVQEAAARRELHEHPDRVDARVVMVLTGDGTEAAVQHIRGEAPAAAESYPGRIQTGLRALHIACLLTAEAGTDG